MSAIMVILSALIVRSRYSFHSSPPNPKAQVSDWASPAKSCAYTMVASASFAATRRAQSLLSFLDKLHFFLLHPIISTLIRCCFPKSLYMMVHLLTLTRAYMCARNLFRVDLTLNRAIYRPFCYFDFEKWIIGHFGPIRCWFYAYLCSVKPTETSLFGLKLAESGRNPKWEISKQYLCRRNGLAKWN